MKNAIIAWIAEAHIQSLFLLWLTGTWLSLLRRCSPLPSASAMRRRSKMISHACRRACDEARLPWGKAHADSIASIYHLHIIDILCSYLCFRIRVSCHISWCIMIHDMTWYIVISKFVLWGLGLWSGDMISCDIMWYHVGSGTWRSRLELGVIS